MTDSVLEIAVQSLAKLLLAVEGLAVQIFGLHGVKERFHMGVVVHLASSIHALQYAELGELGAELKGGVFDTTIAV